jgi:hypothetical protein
MVVGSFASTAHGEPRSTHDLDLVIDPSPAQLDQLLSKLDLDAYDVDAEVARDALARRAMFNVIEIATAWKIDLVIRRARPFSVEELQPPRTRSSPSSSGPPKASLSVSFATSSRSWRRREMASTRNTSADGFAPSASRMHGLGRERSQTRPEAG